MKFSFVCVFVMRKRTRRVYTEKNKPNDARGINNSTTHSSSSSSSLKCFRITWLRSSLSVPSLATEAGSNPIWLWWRSCPASNGPVSVWWASIGCELKWLPRGRRLFRVSPTAEAASHRRSLEIPYVPHRPAAAASSGGRSKEEEEDTNCSLVSCRSEWWALAALRNSPGCCLWKWFELRCERRHRKGSVRSRRSNFVSSCDSLRHRRRRPFHHHRRSHRRPLRRLTRGPCWLWEVSFGCWRRDPSTCSGPSASWFCAACS